MSHDGVQELSSHARYAARLGDEVRSARRHQTLDTAAV
jgi:hypothetical protein